MTDKSAFCFYGINAKPNQSINNVISHLCDNLHFDFFAHTNDPIVNHTCGWTASSCISLDPQVQLIYEQLSSSAAVQQGIISQNFIATLCSLDLVLNLVSQQEALSGLVYNSVVLHNWNVTYLEPVQFSQLVSTNNVFYNGYISQYGFNHNWMQLDRTAFACFGNLLDQLMVLANLDHPYQQPGDMVDMFCKQNSLITQSLGHKIDMINIRLQPTGLDTF